MLRWERVMDETKAGSRRISRNADLPDWNEGDMRALLAAIVESSEDAIVSKDLNGIVTSWNGAAERIFGYTAAEMIGQPIGIIIPEGREGEELSILTRIRRGERVAHFDTVRRRKNGELISISLSVSPIRGSNGKIIGASKIARDVTERKRLQEAQRILSLEVNHRSKNLLAVVEAIVRQTVGHSSPQDFVKRISQRLRALAANQDLLVDGSWRGAEIGALARAQLAHIDGLIGSRVKFEGDRLVVTPTAAQALGMAFHELATNALKYGALSGELGEVVVEWRVEAVHEEPELYVTWRESGGPAVTVPSRAGFGTTIIERVTGQSLGGTVVTSYAPAGLTWELRAPAGPLLSVVQQLAPVERAEVSAR